MRSWNLDYVEKYNIWQILNYLSKNELSIELENRKSGTIILWENLDRIIYDENKNLITSIKFYEVIRDVEHHLAMYFHRFLETGRLKIWLNDQLITPWDPFLKDEKATQSFPSEYYADGRVKITGYVLPHASKITAEKWDIGNGIYGWTAQQGFYIYRKERLLVAGDWLQIFKKHEHTKLARVMVEIDSSLDFAWQLDIRKSRAVPPKMFADELKRYSIEIINLAVNVFKYRGKQKQRKSGRSTFAFVWITREDSGRDYFKINRAHPIVRSVKAKLSKKNELEILLKLLETTLPVPAIVLNENQNSDQPSSAGIPIDDSDMIEMMQYTFEKLIGDGFSPKKAIEELYFIEPFSNFSHLIENLKYE